MDLVGNLEGRLSCNAAQIIFPRIILSDNTCYNKSMNYGVKLVLLSHLLIARCDISHLLITSSLEIKFISLQQC